MKKMINNVHLEGYLFSHSLETRETGPQSKNPGTPYIRGVINILTDKDEVNVVPVNFSYVSKTTKAGEENKVYTNLLNIIETGLTFENHGEEATKLKVDTSMSVSDFYRDGELVSYPRLDGGFIHFVQNISEDNRNSFEADVLFTSAAEKEDSLILKGIVFDFKQSMIPVEFVVHNEAGIDYFNSLDITPNEPTFTKVSGEIVSKTISTQTQEDTAWGAPLVKFSNKTFREWVIKTSAYSVYDFDSEGVLTKEEVKKAFADREVYLAEVKTRAEEYAAKAQSKTAAPVQPKNGEFKF